MNIRRFRLRGHPLRCRVLVEPPPEEVLQDALRYFGAKCGDPGRSIADERQMRSCAALLRFYGRHPGWVAVDVDEALRSANPPDKPLPVNLREAIHAVAHLGEPKCHGEF